MPDLRRLREALRVKPARCPDGCDATRALFPAAIERELDGAPPDADLYARLDRCPACAAIYVAALDLALSLDTHPVRAASAPKPEDADARDLEVPFHLLADPGHTSVVRGFHLKRNDADEPERRVAEDPPAWPSPPDKPPEPPTPPEEGE